MGVRFVILSYQKHPNQTDSDVFILKRRKVYDRALTVVYKIPRVKYRVLKREEYFLQ